MTREDKEISHAVRRTTGIAALRQLQRLVDEENALEHWRNRWALRIGLGFALAGVLLVLWWLNRSL